MTISTATPHEERQRRTSRWSVLVPVVAAGAGALIAASATTANGTDLRSSRSLELSQLVTQKQQQVVALTKRESRLRDSVSALTAEAGGGSTDSEQAAARALADDAGLTPVKGPALRVSLDDAPRLPAGRTLPGDPSPDMLVVHQQDVQAVVNALWTGGASAIEVMDQRLVNTSAVRCVGNTLLLGGRVYSPPYVITAVGDPKTLQKALDDDPVVQIYRQYVDAYQLGYTVKAEKSVTVPAYDGPLELQHAKAVTG